MTTQVSFEGAACAVCGGRAVQAHHVVYAQHVKARNGDLDARHNVLPLCVVCHERHHNASRRIHVSVLRDENFAFAKGLLGMAAYDYFQRRYAGEDARLDDLLEEGLAA